ncbi:ARS-binding protein 1 [Frankliniella fusca]|uniref:ARS-binding protein 1 n=1 Tax=Frankliniella fusca TaxID=407009 RepID=A0AAE1L8N3_9NEOP|nr:ARS-binding protein 1 [Frankliniella fusca]
MVRNYVRKTERKPTTPRKLNAALKLVQNGWSIRKAAKEKEICRETLRVAYEKFKKIPEVEAENITINLSYQTRNIFPKDLEEEIAQYCMEVARMGYGLSVRQARELAFEIADRNREKLKIPPSWDTANIAGIEWFHGFQKRHPNISIRVPEACSIARAMAFNETNVNIFFNKLSEVRQRHASFMDGSRVYNLDETNTSTVQNVRKILSPKGVRQVHQIKGAERGESVTTCVIIGAYGTLLPPVHIFPRKKFNNDFLINCYPGSVGLANAKGYMTKEVFVTVMDHFIKCTQSSKQNPTLLLLDNVDSHFSTESLDLAKENGVVVFTFPPHCTHKLQPLDVGFFGPFKTYYDQAVSTYLSNNPATPPTIYRVAGFVRDALGRAALPQTIIKSFEAPGIVPFNRNIFTEADFIMAQVTLKPNPTENTEKQTDTAEEPSDTNPHSSLQDEPESAANNNDVSPLIGPLQIRGLPKAKEVAGKERKQRRKGKCMIATDTPEKEEIDKRQEETRQKKKSAEERKNKREKKNSDNRKKQKK